MVSKKIEILIIKYLFQSADSKDLDVLNDWIANEDNQVAFKEYIKTYCAITLSMNDPDVASARDRFLKAIRKDRSVFYKNRTVAIMRYAAIAILFLMLGILAKNYFFSPIDDSAIVPRHDAITLKLSNGEVEVISEEGPSKIIKANGTIVGKLHGKQLVYQADGGELAGTLNTLSVPNGKRFNVVLSDGTRVHLNSGSSITYPVEFKKDTVRHVSLIGEGYFEVAHDDERLFIVNTFGLDVRVYGTQFNISSYPEDDDTVVALVEGSLSLVEQTKNESGKGEFYLEPGFKGSFNRSNKNITREKINTAIYTSWMTGNLVLRNETFENIIRKLERHYNVTIINNNEKLGGERFNATIETEQETIEQVFRYFKKVYNVEYSIVENKIVIN